MPEVDRYAVNDALSELASRFGVTLDDDTLNELTHHVADILEPPQIVEPRCDVCNIHVEETPEWCGNCGNCGDHCLYHEGCTSPELVLERTTP